MLKHTYGALIGTRVFTQNLPASIFVQVNLRVLAELNVSEMTRIACVRITTRDFLSSLNRAVPYIATPVHVISVITFQPATAYGTILKSHGDPYE